MSRAGFSAGIAALVCVWVAPPGARAFSDPTMFKEQPLMGGGGGRYFTGSLADGYGCNVCHRGGPSPEVTVRGLPVDGYTPGTTYDVELAWTEPQISHALALELVTSTGLGAGRVELPDESSIGPSGRCEGSPDGSVAAWLEHVGTRTVVGVTDCGATTLRFRFTAPVQDSVSFAATVVRSDSMGTSEGDGVLSIRRELHSIGAPAQQTNASCSVQPAGQAGLTGPLGFVLLALASLFRRRR